MNRIRTWDSIENAKQTYCPALLSNGALCTLLDYHGDQQQLALRPEVRYAEHGSFAHFKQMHANFFRAGLRRGDLQRNLISLGHFEEELNGQWRQPLHARQTLNLGAGVTTCANEYGQGVKVKTQAFVHKQESVFALHKEFTNVTAYSLHYFFAEENSRDQERWSEFSARKSRNGSAVTAHWKTAGFHGDDTGTIVLRCSQPCRIEIQGCRVSFLLEGPLEQADFFLIFTDTLYEGEKERTEALRLRRLTERAGFSGLLRQQQALWSAFWDAFILEVPDAAIQETFETALYSLECNFTRWTLPVCINNSAWKGAYFAFNLFTEIFFATGHPQESLKIAAFRHKLLEQAYRRASNRRRQGARYPWLCDEDGVWDVASPGIWTDHVFQMCNIALEVWNCFLYTQDKRLLSEIWYPVLKGCADFFYYQQLYTLQDGRTIIGKCCDLERIGGSEQNAMLTTCGAIGTLEWAAQAARVLETDGDQAAAWEEKAALLRQSLPQDGEKYLPFENAQMKSIGALGGLYPYPVLNRKDPLCQAALDDFLADPSVGNMYRVGRGLCTWYADWAAIALFRSGRPLEGIQAMGNAIDMTGAFRAIFEINEPGAFVSFPWCSAPNASFAQAALEMLLWTENDTLHLNSEFPADWGALRYQLHAPDDLTVRYEKTAAGDVCAVVSAGPAHSGQMKAIHWLGVVRPLSLRPGESLRLEGKAPLPPA